MADDALLVSLDENDLDSDDEVDGSSEIDDDSDDAEFVNVDEKRAQRDLGT